MASCAVCCADNEKPEPPVGAFVDDVDFRVIEDQAHFSFNHLTVTQ